MGKFLTESGANARAWYVTRRAQQSTALALSPYIVCGDLISYFYSNTDLLNKSTKKRSKQLALAFINTGAGCRVSTVVFGWALDLTESGASATAC